MHLRTAASLAIIFALSVANVQATLIDSFDTDSQSFFVSASQPNSSGQVNPGSIVTIGGYRDVALQWLSGSKSFIDVLTGLDGSGLSFTQGTGEASASVTWDGANSPNVRSYALGANLTTGGGTQFSLDIAKVTDTGVGLTLTVYSDATHASAYTSLMAAGTSGVVSVPYTSFTQVGADGPANFASVGAIVLQLNGSGHIGSDITINSIQAATTGVPEPSTLVMTAIVGMAFVGWRRWRRA